MSTKHIYYCILTAVIIVALYHLFAVGRFSYPEFRVKAGQVAEFELIAPFDFPVLKSAETILKEQQETLVGLRIPQSFSDEVVFEAFKVVDDIFTQLSKQSMEQAVNIKISAYDIPSETLVPLMSATQKEKAYNAISSILENIYKRGVYGASVRDSLLMFSDNKLFTVNKSEFYSLEEAQKRFMDAFNDQAFAAFAKSLVPYVIKENIYENETKYQEIKEQKINELPTTEGVILQNEVIIRKNARLTDNDIVKLQSLQEAYKERNIRRSIWEQALLTLGLLIFNLIIVLAVSYYFKLQTTSSESVEQDISPIHLGFVFIVILSLVNNLILGYSNLLIPFALTVISAAILVSLEFGFFYMISSFLIMSPFINWETYTPVIFILSTMLTLIMIKKQNAYHDYFTIWLYLVISSIIVGITIAIYKNDQFVVLLKNLGLLLISSTLSVIGIMLIVPYYERKWNRATKQILLELLDFNHPLLKKLATDAVGTYHHSLIVGNLTERAAEAIGANPLLARVGSYYHDIGKVMNTGIFTENNEDSSDIHSTFTAEESAAFIKRHVLDGIEQAQKYKIPEQVIDIIKQHHGTGYIKFFLDKAEKTGLEVDPLKFQYPGPKPKTKEAALVMLADQVESITKAKASLKEDDIRKIIDDTILRIIKEGQFDDAPISLNDLKVVRDSMIPVLSSIYRKRLDYPESPQNA